MLLCCWKYHNNNKTCNKKVHFYSWDIQNNWNLVHRGYPYLSEKFEGNYVVCPLTNQSLTAPPSLFPPGYPFRHPSILRCYCSAHGILKGPDWPKVWHLSFNLLLCYIMVYPLATHSYPFITMCTKPPGFSAVSRGVWREYYYSTNCR